MISKESKQFKKLLTQHSFLLVAPDSWVWVAYSLPLVWRGVTWQGSSHPVLDLVVFEVFHWHMCGRCCMGNSCHSRWVFPRNKNINKQIIQGMATNSSQSQTWEKLWSFHGHSSKSPQLNIKKFLLDNLRLCIWTHCYCNCNGNNTFLIDKALCEHCLRIHNFSRVCALIYSNINTECTSRALRISNI